jgi:ADP-ribose pyrophosphatase
LKNIKGMVDPGEKVSVTLKREFMEEALNSEELSEAKRNELHEKLKELFDNGVEVCQVHTF